MLTRQDWLLIALSKSPGGAMSPVQVQKSLFLFGQEAGGSIGAEFYSFEPYDYGPFDAAICADLRRMTIDGHVRGNLEPRSKLEVLHDHQVPAGVPCSPVEQDADPRLTEFLGRIVQWVKGRSFSDLLRSIYAAYPEFAVNSVFRGK